MSRHTRSHSTTLLRGSGARVFVGTFATLFGLTVFQSAAVAGQPPDLSSTVLTDTLPGFVASPPGTATNGPINQSNVNYFGAAASDLAQFIANGSISGYLRTWAHEPLNGDVVVITALWFNDPNQIGAVMAGVNNGSQQAGATPFAVPGIDGGLGFSVDKAGNQSFQVTFAKGSILFTVGVVSGFHDLTSADAVSLAVQQAGRAPGGVPAPLSVPATTSTGSVAYDAGQAIGGALMTILLAVGLVLLFRGLRKRRRPSPGTGGASFETAFTQEPFAPVGSASPPYQPPSAPVPDTKSYVAPIAPYRSAGAVALAEPPATPAPSPVGESGWKTDPADPRHIAYWDGTQYTSHMRWDGTQWVDY